MAQLKFKLFVNLENNNDSVMQQNNSRSPYFISTQFSMLVLFHLTPHVVIVDIIHPFAMFEFSHDKMSKHKSSAILLQVKVKCSIIS